MDYFANGVRSTLSSDIDDSQVTFTIEPIGGLPATGDFMITVCNRDKTNAEIMKVTSRIGYVLTVERGAEAWAGFATPLSHVAGELVVITMTAGTMERASASEIVLEATVDGTAQISDIINTKGKKSMSVWTEVYSDNGSIQHYILTRVLGKPWATFPAIETFTDSGIAIFSIGTTWGNQGTQVPAIWHDFFFGLLDESALVVSMYNGGDEANLTPEFFSAQAWYIFATGASSGTFKLTFRSQTTTTLNFDSTENEILAALQALSTIGPNGVRNHTDGNPIGTLNSAGGTFYFSGDLSGQIVEAPTVTDSTVDVTVELNEYTVGGESIYSPIFTLNGNIGLSELGNMLSVTFVDPYEADHPLVISSDDGFNMTFTLRTDSLKRVVTDYNEISLVLSTWGVPFIITSVSAEPGISTGPYYSAGPLSFTGGTEASVTPSYRVYATM